MRNTKVQICFSCKTVEARKVLMQIFINSLAVKVFFFVWRHTRDVKKFVRAKLIGITTCIPLKKLLKITKENSSSFCDIIINPFFIVFLRQFFFILDTWAAPMRRLAPEKTRCSMSCSSAGSVSSSGDSSHAELTVLLLRHYDATGGFRSCQKSCSAPPACKKCSSQSPDFLRCIYQV